MIVVKVELWSAITHQASEIGRMYIANDGSGSADRGDYLVGVCRRGTDDVPAPVNPNGPKATRAGTVKDYPRLAYNMWRLIARSVVAAFPEERNPKGVAPVVDHDVMLGLQELALVYQERTNNSDAMNKALAWINQAGANQP